MNKSVGTSYLEGWKKIFVYKGNTTRKDFWSFVLVNLFIILLVAVSSLLWLISVDEMGLVWVFFVLVPLYWGSLFLIIPLLSLGCRRMHDIGKSGWWFGGFVCFNIFVIPLVLTLVSHVTEKWGSEESGNVIIYIIYGVLTVVSFISPVWLCCKPTKLNTRPHLLMC